MNDSFDGDFNATQTASGGAASEAKTEGIAPVFIKQLLESPENNFQLFGMHFGIVSLAAIVRSIEPSSTKFSYTLEDHTGRIEAHYWIEDGDESVNSAPNLMLDNYAKVYGCVRSQSNQKTMMIFKMFSITDPNEVCTHMLEVLNARFKAEKFSKGNEAGGDVVMSDISGMNGGSQNGSAQGGGGNMGLTPKQRAVFDLISAQRNNAEGIARKVLYDKFRHVSQTEIDSILEFLVSEGHIYSSVDPDHFLSTE